MAPPLLDELPMRAFAPRLLTLAVCLFFVACGGVEGDGGFDDESFQALAETSDPLIATIRVVDPVGSEEGLEGRVVPTVVVPLGTVGGSSPDPIPARQAVAGPPDDRRFDLRFPECEPFPAGLWRDACNRSLGGSGR